MSIYMRYIVIFIALLLTANVTAATHNGKNIDNKEYKCDVKVLKDGIELFDLINETCIFKDMELTVKNKIDNDFFDRPFKLESEEVKDKLVFHHSYANKPNVLELIITVHFNNSILPNNFNYNF